MNITILPNRAPYVRDTTLSFEQSEEILGRVSIKFESGETYEKASCNVPLFLAEIKIFMDRVERFKFDKWTFMFSPFLHGRMDSDRLIITRPRPHDREDVIEILGPKDLDLLRKTLEDLQKVYGVLEPLTEVANRKEL